MRKATMLRVAVAVAVLVIGVMGFQLVQAEEGSGGDTKLLQALAKSQHTLAQGIQQAAKAPQAAISAKFELDDKGDLSLSVYTAEKGLAVDAEHNVLKELSGNPTNAQWKPETEVFKDVEHVARSTEQLTLMALTRHSLLDVIKMAEKDQPGFVYSITPTLRDRRPLFVVLIAAEGKPVELDYDLMTGRRLMSKPTGGSAGY